MKRIALFTLIATAFILNGCSWFKIYKVNTQQGNIIKPSEVKLLKPGMSSSQVKQLIGTPLLVNTFHDDTFYYVYTFQRSNHPRIEKHLTLYFRNDKLLRYDLR